MLRVIPFPFLGKAVNLTMIYVSLHVELKANCNVSAVHTEFITLISVSLADAKLLFVIMLN